jgi:hypothetical protein
MQRPYFCLGAPMNVFMLIHDSPSHWLVCRKNNKFYHHLFCLLSESTRIIRILKQANIVADPDEQRNHSTPKLLLGGTMNEFMSIHVPSSHWLVCRKNNKFNHRLFCLLSESSRIIRILKQANIVADPDEQRNHATPFLITRCKHEYKCDNPCFAEWLIGVMLKTTNSTITYFIFPQNHLRVKCIGSSRIIRKIKQGNIFTVPNEQHNHATLLITRWEHEYKCDNSCFLKLYTKQPPSIS